MFQLDHDYASLPQRCYAEVFPTPVRAPSLLSLNVPLARQLGLDPGSLSSEQGLATLAGNSVPAGALPLAMAYAGHQFAHFVPQLGDGRAILLGELRDVDGVRHDLQLKGAGPTPFSRGGDGRAWMGPVLREYVLSEAMYALGVPTTRALAAVASGEPVLRERALPGAVLTRVARSHLRVGTFEYFAWRGDIEALEALTAHTLTRHDPERAGAERPALALLEGVVRRQAELVAQWLSLGFIHGVMNTDNCSIIGDTLDYGPCAFLDVYQPDKVFSSIDHAGRYAFGNQPRVAHWNLAVLAHSLEPMLDAEGKEAASVAIGRFSVLFSAAYQRRMRAKIGLGDELPGDEEMIASLLAQMAAERADFSRTFRALSQLGAAPTVADDLVRVELSSPRALDPWLLRWRHRLAQEPGSDAQRRSGMLAVNPAYIPRNHQVQTMIDAAIEGDLAPLERLIEVLAKPFEEREGLARFAAAPEAHEQVHATFCGT